MRNYQVYGRRRIERNLRKKIYKRDGYKCLKCGETEWLTIDHVVPLGKGGTNRENNLITLCKKCNQEKGTEIWHEFLRI